MGLGVEADEALMGKTRKKSKTNNKNKANASDGLGDCTGVMSGGVEDSFELSKEVETKKKDKKKVESSGDVELDGLCNEGTNVKDCTDEALIGKKSKTNKKNKANASDRLGAFTGVMSSGMEDSFELSKEVKAKKKNKKKAVSSGYVNLDGLCNKGTNVKDYADGIEVGKVREKHSLKVSEKVEKKKRKREKKKGKDDLGVGLLEMTTEEMGNESTMHEDKDFVDGNAHSTGNEMQAGETKNVGKGNRKRPNSIETGSKDLKPKGKSKKVRISGHVEVFPSSEGPSKGKEKNQEYGLVQGKRFSPEEDEMIKEAVLIYAEAYGLGEEGVNMILHCKSYPKLKNCWKEIGTVLPYRPYKAVYSRAHSLFERAEKRSWSTEELELVWKFHEEHGPKWKELADAVGKHRIHLKDTWRRLKLPNQKKGNWSQEEYQNLFNLVNIDLRMKAFEEKKSKHGMLRDNICWGAISDKLSTRTDAMCCMKWYNQLTSAMVAEGIWADADDYHLLNALFSLDACCVEDVDWDSLLDHRSGDVCRKRWNQMVGHIGEHGNKSFAEQVEILSKRYCLDILEAREAWDSKPVVS